MPPFHYDPYDPRFAGSLGNLIARSGDAPARAIATGGQAQARAVEIGGQAAAQAAISIGNGVSSVMHDIMRLKLDQPRREMEALHLKEAKRTDAEATAIREAYTAGKGDPDQVLAALEGKGNYLAASQVRAELTKQKIQGLDLLDKSLKTTNERLTTASQLLQGVSRAATPEAAAEAYAQILPQVREIVGQNLASQLPDVYDAAKVNQAVQWGMKASDVAAMRRAAAAESTAAMRNSVTKVDLADKLTKSTARWATTIDSQEEWDQMLASVKKLGGDTAPDILSKFDPTYSPAAVQNASKLLGDQKFQHETVLAKGPNGKTIITEAGYDQERNLWFAPGSTTPLENVRKFVKDTKEGVSVSQQLVDAVKENPEVWRDLTDSYKSALIGDARMAGFTPPPAKDAGASRAVAERWKLTQLHKIDENLGYGVITAEQAATQRAEVQKSFDAQIGTPAPAAKPPKPNPVTAPKGAKPKADAAPVEGATKEIPGYPGTEQTFKNGKWIRTK